jgi:hypothetical protein
MPDVAPYHAYWATLATHFAAATPACVVAAGRSVVDYHRCARILCLRDPASVRARNGTWAPLKARPSSAVRGRARRRSPRQVERRVLRRRSSLARLLRQQIDGSGRCSTSELITCEARNCSMSDRRRRPRPLIPGAEPMRRSAGHHTSAVISRWPRRLREPRAVFEPEIRRLGTAGRDCADWLRYYFGGERSAIRWMCAGATRQAG